MAPGNLDLLLIDHANCEKKAAASALNLMFKYVDRPELLQKMSSLAREELRHFEQVHDLMSQQGVEYRHISAARYASKLHGAVSSTEPNRLVDLLLVGAIVEARSCERFTGLVEVLPQPVAELYASLVRSEARHFQDYLALARAYAESGSVDTRLDELLDLDAELVTASDPDFRFHSGVPG